MKRHTLVVAAWLGAAGPAFAQAPAASGAKPVAKPAAAKPATAAAKPAAAKPAGPKPAAGKPAKPVGSKPAAGQPVAPVTPPTNTPPVQPKPNAIDDALSDDALGEPPAKPGDPATGKPAPSDPADPKGDPTGDPADPGDPGDDPRAGRNAGPAPTPVDPLKVPDEIKDRLGVGDEQLRNGAVGPVSRRLRPYYEESRGDYRLRLVPPLYLEHTRGLPQRDQPAGTVQPDTEGLYGLLYYRRRSLHVDADVVFPAFWRLREDQRTTTVLGPLVHQEESASATARATHANWFAPLVFEGIRKDGGYFHLPIALTLTKWSEKSAFTLVGPYLRIRKERSVDQGLFPFFLHGDNHDQDGARRSYTLVPPALFFKRDRELDDSHLTIVGPVYRETNLKRSITNVLPLFWHIDGKPESGGMQESHTTLLPFFHYGRSEEKSLFVLPGYLRRVTATSDTMLTPLVSFASTRRGKTNLFAAGPLVPLVFNYSDKDTGLRWTGAFPLFLSEHSPRGYTLATPLFVTDRNYGVNRNNWAFPNLFWGNSNKGWHAAFAPLVFAGRSEKSTHTVLAPLFWDFASPKTRTTIGFPVYWRFAKPETRSITQVAGNTVYIERHVRGGQDWQFHVAPVFSYGRSPTGHFWNILFGLAGYSRKGDDAYVRALWIPFHVSGGGKKPAVAESHGARSEH